MRSLRTLDESERDRRAQPSRSCSTGEQASKRCKAGMKLTHVPSARLDSGMARSPSNRSTMPETVAGFADPRIRCSTVGSMALERSNEPQRSNRQWRRDASSEIADSEPADFERDFRQVRRRCSSWPRRVGAARVVNGSNSRSSATARSMPALALSGASRPRCAVADNARDHPAQLRASACRLRCCVADVKGHARRRCEHSVQDTTDARAGAGSWLPGAFASPAPSDRCSSSSYRAHYSATGSRC